RRRFRNVNGKGTRNELNALVESPELGSLSPACIVLLGRALVRAGAPDKAAEVLIAAQERTPNDLWLNVELGLLLRWRVRPPRLAESSRYWQAALALKPHCASAWVGLGTAIIDLPGQLDRAGAALQRAVDLDPNFYDNYNALGAYHLRKGNLARTVSLYRHAL